MTAASEGGWRRARASDLGSVLVVAPLEQVVRRRGEQLVAPRRHPPRRITEQPDQLAGVARDLRDHVLMTAGDDVAIVARIHDHRVGVGPVPGVGQVVGPVPEAA